MNLTPAERSRILAGNHKSLRRPEKPSVAMGDRLVVVWGKERRHVSDERTGAVTRTPAQPLMWLEVLAPPFLLEGEWVVRFHVVDRRDPARLLQRGAGEDGRGYGSSPIRAIDDLEAVDDPSLKHFGKNRETFLEAKLEEEQRRQDRNLREREKRALRGMTPDERAEYLAERERDLRRVEENAA